MYSCTRYTTYASKFSVGKKIRTDSAAKKYNVFILAESKVNRDIKLKSISGVRQRFPFIKFQILLAIITISNLEHAPLVPCVNACGYDDYDVRNRGDCSVMVLNETVLH